MTGQPDIPCRVVSLVPSLTESMFDLGLGASLVGVTDYCIHPAELTGPLAKVGGPGDARLESILALEPDLVLAGREENDRETVQALQKAGVRVHLVFPKTVLECTSMLVDLGRLFQSEDAIMKAQTLEITTEWQAAAAQNRLPVKILCPIWKDRLPDGTPWWMTFNQETYASSLISLFGGVNVFGGRRRSYPLEADLGQASEEPSGDRDERYPRLNEDEIRHCGAQIVFLPDEPYPFGEADALEFCRTFPDLPACRAGRVYTLDGSLISWYGTRLARALDQLGPFFDD